KLTGQKGDPFFNLLDRIDGILDKTDPDARSSEQRRQDYDRYKEESREFYTEISELMSTLPLDQATPKTKIIVRLPLHYVPPDVGIDDQISFSQTGPTAGIFVFKNSSNRLPTMERFCDLHWPRGASINLGRCLDELDLRRSYE